MKKYSDKFAESGTLSLEGFASYLSGEDAEAMLKEHKIVYQVLFISA